MNNSNEVSFLVNYSFFMFFFFYFNDITYFMLFKLYFVNLSKKLFSEQELYYDIYSLKNFFFVKGLIKCLYIDLTM